MNKIKKNQELNPLNPKKYHIHLILKKYGFFSKEKKAPAGLTPASAKSYARKKPKSLIFLIIAFACIVFIFLFSSYFLVKPPLAVFLDKDSGNYIDGSVYLDSEHIGETVSGRFNKLPSYYCDDKHVIALRTKKGIFEWATYPVDCKAKSVNFEISLEESVSIIFNFADKNTSNHLNGKLYFDDDFISNIEGHYLVSRQICKNIDTIRLEYDSLYTEWNNNIDMCESYNAINFSV